MSNVWNVVWPVIVLASVLALFAAGRYQAVDDVPGPVSVLYPLLDVFRFSPGLAADRGAA